MNLTRGSIALQHTSLEAKASSQHCSNKCLKTKECKLELRQTRLRKNSCSIARHFATILCRNIWGLALIALRVRWHSPPLSLCLEGLALLLLCNAVETTQKCRTLAPSFGRQGRRAQPAGELRGLTNPASASKQASKAALDETPCACCNASDGRPECGHQ